MSSSKVHILLKSFMMNVPGTRPVEKVKLKALTDHLEGGSRVYSFDLYWQTGGSDILSNFKGPSSQDQQKTIRCRLITSKVTLTGQSHFMLIFVLCKVTLRDHTTLYNECTQLVQKILWFN